NKESPTPWHGELRHARLAAEPANPLQHARRKKQASSCWHGANVTRIARRDVILEALCGFQIFNELALEAQTAQDRREASHAKSADWPDANKLAQIAFGETDVSVESLAVDLQLVNARTNSLEHAGISVECRHYRPQPIRPPWIARRRAWCRVSGGGLLLGAPDRGEYRPAVGAVTRVIGS